MKLTRLSAAPGPLLEFVEQGLERLGAACERTWHDRLEVVAEGAAARLWRDDAGLHEIELHFPEVNATGPRDATRQVFVGGPLTFRLVDLLWQQHGREARLCLGPSLAGDAPPATPIAAKVWLNQFGVPAQIGDQGWERTWHFSVVAAVRCEVQAIEQHWSCHRIALSVADGERDGALERELEFLEGQPSAAGLSWPSPSPQWPAWLERALRSDLAAELDDVRRRQERFLRRELARVDEYFLHYASELRGRMERVHKTESRQRYEARLRAAESEHQRRRADQVQRHEIRIIPHVDAVLWVAEPAWRTHVQGRHGERLGLRTFVLRSRRWHASPP